ncbi:MAG: DeoR/GlpR family DNA-binding transcription regulator [Cyanobacteriota bacterium]
MLKEERLDYILKKLGVDNKVLSTQLSKLLKVSDDTVRRDLHELSIKGLIKKVHGGAIPKTSIPLNYNERSNYSEEEKHDIAKKALSLIKENQVIIIDGGTTALEVVRLMPIKFKATIFTNSLPVAMELTDYPNINLILLGGTVLKRSKVTIGLENINTLEGIRADLMLLGITSIHPEIGLTLTNWEESKVKKKMIEVSNKVIALATNDKLDRADNYFVCSYKDIDILILDKNIDPIKLESYQNKGVEVLY